MAGVINPGQHQGLLDQVAKGLSVARDIYGIKSAMDESDARNQQRQDEKNGVFTPKEMVGLGDKFNIVDQTTPGAQKVSLREGDAVHDVFIMPKQKPFIAPPAKVVGNALLTFDQKTNTWSPAYTAPEKQQKPDLMAMETVDDNGITGMKIVPKVAGSFYAKPNKPEKAPDYGKVYSDLVTHVETPRGNQAVQQASNALRSVGVANELINQYPNPNEMPPDKVSLLNQEISKIASGGVGSEHGQKSLEANTFAEKWARFTQTIGNEPSGAQLGSFIQQNKDYLEGVAKVNQDVINKYQLNIYKGYKGRLTPEQDQGFQQDYPHLFAPKETSQITATKPAGGSGTAQGAAGVGKTAPGSVVKVGGKNYTVAPDGDTLIPVGGQ